MVKYLPPRGVHSYQTTVVPRSDLQLATATQKRYQYPWAENVNTPVYQVPGTDSSTSDNAYQVPQHYTGTMRKGGPPSPLYHAPYEIGTWRSYKKGPQPTGSEPNTYVFPQCTSAFSLPLCSNESYVPSRPSQSPVPSTSPELTVGACGGHCPAFEYVCYYVLQVLFVVGLLTGISLCIAGIVLRRTNRNGDLGVLVYIGCLSSCVCGVLLGVQGCARRELRKRKMRARTHIPMQPIQPEQPIVQSCQYTSTTLPHSQVYRPSVNVYQEEEEITGVPWWRRTAN